VISASLFGGGLGSFCRRTLLRPGEPFALLLFFLRKARPQSFLIYTLGSPASSFSSFFFSTTPGLWRLRGDGNP